MNVEILATRRAYSGECDREKVHKQEPARQQDTVYINTVHDRVVNGHNTTLRASATCPPISGLHSASLLIGLEGTLSLAKKHARPRTTFPRSPQLQRLVLIHYHHRPHIVPCSYRNPRAVTPSSLYLHHFYLTQHHTHNRRHGG